MNGYYGEMNGNAYGASHTPAMGMDMMGMPNTVDGLKAVQMSYGGGGGGGVVGNGMVVGGQGDDIDSYGASRARVMSEIIV